MTAANRPAHEYIATAEALTRFCDALGDKPYIAIDTEFLRENTYRPQLCLVQVKHGDLLACIDTLAIDDLAPLIRLLLNDAVTKVLHSGSQDLEIFYLLCRQVPTPIFDTQLAAPLLGFAEQIGYANLVQEHLGVELAKSQTRADWTRRPLPHEQITYALDDVIYLEALYLDMHAQLEQRGRLPWLKPEFAEWEQADKYDQPAAERWKKVRNIQRYKGPALSIIQSLATWRELQARERNLPRNWVLKDDVLVTLAQQQPGSLDELNHIRGLPRTVLQRYGNDLIKHIARARDETPEPLPAFVRKKKLNAENLARVQLLDAWAHQRAAELDIAPRLLAPRKAIERFVTGDGRAALHGWRNGLLGDDFAALLEGRAVLKSTTSGLQLLRAGQV